jgi:hypothetical protein
VTVSMISPVSDDFDAVRDEVRAAAGQLTCAGWRRAPPDRLVPA